MIDYEEIESEITRLESCDTDYANIEKLAMLYTVRNNVADAKEGRSVTHELPTEDKSDFMAVVDSVPLDKVLSVIDEHFEAVKAIYPKEYEEVIKKLTA